KAGVQQLEDRAGNEPAVHDDGGITLGGREGAPDRVADGGKAEATLEDSLCFPFQPGLAENVLQLDVRQPQVVVGLYRIHGRIEREEEGELAAREVEEDRLKLQHPVFD